MLAEARLRLDVRNLSEPTGSPWTGDQLSRLLVSNLAALAGILAAAYGAAQSDEIQTTLLWFNLSMAGLAVAGVSNALWLLRSRAAVGTARGIVLGSARDVIVTSEAAESEERDSLLAWAPALRRYHVPGCALVADRPVQFAAASDLDARGLAPCEVCLP
jgi:hypothetical protein